MLTDRNKTGILPDVMEQLSLFQPTVHTVSDLTRYIRQLLEMDEILRDVWVQGEISNLSRPASGHIYFTLKDAGAALRCAMWRHEAARLNTALQDGLAVEVHGRIGVYEVSGQYQLYVDQIRPMGEGALFKEFLRLKAVLEAEGLFDPANKQPVLEGPLRSIGIVTSATGAALRDMLNTIARRFPLSEVILAPSQVQGEDAPPQLVKALQSLDLPGEVDVILLARGGGSIEDLWAFNDARVVRAVAASSVPVITGVGHETDFTLSDFAADLRAPTPTAAAELATPVTLQDLYEETSDLETRMVSAVCSSLEMRRLEVRNQQSRLVIFSPMRRIQIDRQYLDDLVRRGLRAVLHRHDVSQERLNGLQQKLKSLNPMSILERGFAVVTTQAEGSLISQAAQVEKGDDLQVRFADGKFDVTVTDTHRKKS
ncbi:MAG: exodeoxyribonuclease VII large subunit [Anaerolineales bacterium]|nr:exodeoxyribonuclease VII large subunit [Anaerolineales bacterium]